MFRRRSPSRSASSQPASRHPDRPNQQWRQRRSRHGLKCILDCIEQLEQRRLLTTLVSTSGLPRTFEYIDGDGKTMRILMQGNIRAEFIAAEVPDNSNSGGNLPHIKLRPRDLIPATGGQNQQSDGYDLFEIYIADSDINSSISIAQVPASGNDRPMQPFSGGVGDFRITNATTGRSETVDPGNATGSAILGTRTGDTIMNTELEQDIAITSIGFKQRWGIRPAVPSGKFDAGLIVAPGNDLGQFLFGGVVIGRVSIGGNMNLFYCGALWTGDATGEFALQGPVSRRNFDVEGDLRNLVTIGSIGTTDLPDATDNPASMQVKTGVDIHVKGRLGQIMTKNAWLGAVTVDGDPSVKGSGLPQQEIEARRFPAPNDSQSFFEGFPFDFNPQLTRPSLGDNPIFNNDTPDTAQYVGTFRSAHAQNPLTTPFPAGLNQNDAIELDGVLNGDGTDSPSTGTARDDVDYYAVALMAGQTADVQLTAINPDPTFLTAGALPLIHVGVFDPDNRLIATDYNNNPQATVGLQGQNALKTHFENPTFQFTAQRPGIYKFAVANESDANFNGVTDEPRGVIFYPGSFHEYRLDITHVANIAFGGLVASNSIAFTDGPSAVFGSSSTPSLDVMNGDLGAVVSTASGSADTLIFNDTPVGPVPFTTPWRIRKGNLRVVVAPSIGISDDAAAASGDPLLTLSFVVPKGSVGLLRTTGTGPRQTLAVNNSLVDDRQTGSFDPANIVGVDYQVVDAASSFTGDLMAGRGIGTIRADVISAHDVPCRIAVNADNRNSDGFIDLIDVRSQMGTLTSGGPQITTGDNGNVRYIVAPPAAVFRDRFFGGGQIQPTTFNAGQVVKFTDDSGTAYKLIPGPQLVNSSGAVLNATTLNTTTYPIRDKGGQVLINVTQIPAVITNIDGTVTVGGNQSLTVDSGPAGKSGFVEIGTINVLSPGTTFDFDQFNRTVVPVAPTGGAASTNVLDDVILKGKAVVDVWNITANGPTGGGLVGITRIDNQTSGGEIANVQAAHIGSISADTVGMPKSHSGALVEGVDVRISGLPFNNQRVLINAAGTSGTGAGFIGTINARRAVGNVHAASIGNVNANSDRLDAKGVFEGIAGPIWAQQTGTIDPKQGNIHAVNIGEGVGFGGTGNDVFAAGLFADGLIDSVSNSGQAIGSDIHGPVVALRHTTDVTQTTTDPNTGVTTTQSTPFTGIGGIKLTNGSIIDADVMVVLDYIDALETVRSVILAPQVGSSTFGQPINLVQSIDLNGIGGILGSTFVADNLGPINIKGGFGMVASTIRAGGNATTSGIIADGFGIRQSYLDIGAAMGSLIATGTGKRLSVTEYDPNARLSERNTFDPFSGRLLDPYNDLHKFFGTSKSNPKKKGKTEAGVIADTTVIGGRTIDRVDAYRIIGGPDVIDTVTGDPAMRIAFGNQIGKITVRNVVDGLQVTGGGVSLFQTGSDVSALNMSSAGRINKVIIGGNLKSNSTIRATGSDGRLDTLTVKRSLMGRVNTSVMLGTVTSGDLGSHDLSSSNDIGTLIINGSILSGATVRARDTIQSLNVGKNIQTDATVIARKIESQNIKGQVFGDVVITG
jgi:hypothetical protein